MCKILYSFWKSLQLYPRDTHCTGYGLLSGTVYIMSSMLVFSKRATIEIIWKYSKRSIGLRWGCLPAKLFCYWLYRVGGNQTHGLNRIFLPKICKCSNQALETWIIINLTFIFPLIIYYDIHSHSPMRIRNADTHRDR